jgi:hypothetical protein
MLGDCDFNGKTGLMNVLVRLATSRSPTRHRDGCYQFWQKEGPECHQVLQAARSFLVPKAGILRARTGSLRYDSSY